MLQIGLTPAGHLSLFEVAEAEDHLASGLTGPGLPEEALRQAHARGQAELLLMLACRSSAQGLDPAAAFWRRLGERYLTELCHIPEHEQNLDAPLVAPLDELAEMAVVAPPMRGGEYLRAETLAGIWDELDVAVRRDIAAEPGGFSAWLRRRSPQWHRVGRVCFHLAENKRDPVYPFAFLATYAPGMLEGGRVQYLPLGKALEQYAGAKNRKVLLNLLTPVRQAAERCPWVQELVESGQVFHPTAWTADEAHRLLVDVPQLEASGLLVRVPDWWARRGSRMQVGVSVDRKGPGRLDAAAMLDFKVELSLDGEPISEEEWAAILAGTQSMVLLKGRWVEVDRERLQEALSHWKQVARQAGQDGVSFLEGMRLLAGAPIDSSDNGLFDGPATAWSQVHAGPGLAELLRQIREPDSVEARVPPPELQATLRPYQITGVKWLWLLSRLGLGSCLADDMGLGKTIQVLALLIMLRHHGKEGSRRPALLVLPASLLGNWRSEIERFAPSLRCLFAHPSQATPEQLKALAADPAKAVSGLDAVLTTYAMLGRLEGLHLLDWSLAVLDEAQAIKNPAARQTQTVKRLKAGARIALTGTPVENRLSDLWSIFDFLCPGLLGSLKAFSTFLKRLDRRSSDQYGSLRRLVAPYILRRMKTDRAIISDLPDKVELQAFCHLSHKQAAMYQESVQALREALDAQEAGIARKGIVLAFIMRFKQICNHPDQWLGTGGYDPQESGKFRRLGELCEEIAERQDKVLVFSQFREMTEPLAAFLAGVFGRPGLVLHGQTPVARRKHLVDAFQADDGPPFMVLSLKAGGTGLNLTAAAHVIHFDRWWNPAVENQASDRAFRIGQRSNVMVHKFVCQGTIEERIDALIRDKTALAGELLQDSAARLVTEMSDRELLDLVRLDITRAAED